MGASSIYEFPAELLSGETVGLGKFRGQVLLIVNTASKCGYTPQYAGLEELYQRYRDLGLVVLGFPCNQFGGQEPGGAEEIGKFCEKNYGVSFPMFAKIEVNGPGAHPLYQYLKAEKPGFLGWLGSSAIRWNFAKFLVGRDGSVLARFAPATKPRRLTHLIEKALER